MWPSGEVKVCKTCNGGSNPSMTSINPIFNKFYLVGLFHALFLFCFMIKSHLDGWLFPFTIKFFAYLKDQSKLY